MSRALRAVSLALVRGWFAISVVFLCQAVWADDQPGATRSPAGAMCERSTTMPSCFIANKLVDRIVFCANTDKYYVFFQERFDDITQYCISPSDWEDVVKQLTEDRAQLPEGRKPLGENAKKIKPLVDDNEDIFLDSGKTACESTDAHSSLSQRVAHSQDVTEVLSHPRLRPGRTPIGMMAGIFCDKVGLRGLDIDHSLLFEYSVLVKGAIISYATTAANLSFNFANIGQDLMVFRSRILGGVYLYNAAANRLIFSQSAIYWIRH